MQKHYSSISNAKNWLIASLVLIAWLVLSSMAGPVFAKLSNVSTNDQSSFLPSSADSTKVQNLEPKFLSLTSIPAVIVSVSNSNLTHQQIKGYETLVAKLRQVSGVVNTTNGVIGPVIASDHKAVEIIVQINSNAKTSDVVSSLSATVAQYSPQHTSSYVTGPAGLAAALLSAFNGINSTLIYVTLTAVLIVLLIVYRSIILPFIVLITAGLALTVAGFAVYHGVNANWFKLNGESQGSDELGLLHELEHRGKVGFSLNNPVFTSGRRLNKGLFYNLFVTCFYYYVIGYILNSKFNRQVIKQYPAFRDNVSKSKLFPRWLIASEMLAILVAVYFLPNSMLHKVNDYRQDFVRFFETIF